MTLLTDDEVIRQTNLKFLPRMQLINFLFDEPEKNIRGYEISGIQIKSFEGHRNKISNDYLIKKISTKNYGLLNGLF